MTPLLLLHPLGSDRSFWSPCPGLLGRPVLAPDLLGHGTADLPPLSATLAAFTEQVAAVLSDPVVVVGVSLGGLVAQDLAARHPELVTGVVLVDTVAAYPSPFRDTWPERAAVARTSGLEPLADPMEQMWFSSTFRERHPREVAVARRRLTSSDAEGYARVCEVLYAADTTELLPRIAVPTLVVCGDQDAPAFVEAAPRLASDIPDAELVWLEGGKHAGVIEQPEAFAAAVQAFLGRRGL